MMSPAPKKAEDAPREGSLNENGIGSGVEGLMEPPVNTHFGNDSEDETLPNDDTELNNGGYQLLSAEPAASVDTSVFEQSSNSTTDENVESTGTLEACSGYVGDRDFEIPDQPLWESVTLDTDKVENIKSIMATFVLPPSQHPTWATAVPEDGWKEHLLERIRSRDGNEK